MTNLLKIRDAYKEFRNYKDMFDQNEKAFEKMEKEVKQRTAVEMLTGITTHCSENPDVEVAHKMVVSQVGPRFGLRL